MPDFKYLVVRDGIYPHKVEKVLEYEKQQLALVGAEFRMVPCQTEDDVIAAGANADAMLAAGRGRYTRRVLESLKRCKVIVNCGVGYDRVDVEAATDLGIAVCNIPDFCYLEVADHTMALLLACNRKIVRLHKRLTGGTWDRVILEPMPRLRGRTVGLIGFGRIGRCVCERARSFGMQVLGYDPYVPEGAFAEAGAEKVEVDDLLRRSDFVSIHLPLNSSTRHRLGEREIGLMKPSAFVLNTSRGGVIDEPALIRALQEGRIAGAGLDVFEKEPVDPDNPLLHMENVVATAHAGGYSDDVVEELREKAVAEVIRVLDGGWPRAIAFINPQVAERSHTRS